MLSLFSEEPIYADLEVLRLSDALTFLSTELNPNNDLVQKVLAGKSPHERAEELILGTKVRDVSFRKRLYQGGAGAVSAVNDPMIELARLIDPEARSLRKVSEEHTRPSHARATLCWALRVIRTRRSHCGFPSAR
jgi:hypothetical protein